MKNKTHGKTEKYLLLVLLVIASCCLALLFGGSRLTLSQVIGGLFGFAKNKYVIIIRSIRLPRVLAAMLSGVGLSVSGVLLQSVTDNGLASPNIIGVNSGAGLCTILLLCFFPKAVFALPFAAFIGAFLAAMLIIRLSARMGSSKISIILAGMALNAVLGAGISLVSLIDTDVIAAYNYFSIGGLSGVSLKKLMIPAALILISLCVSLIFSRKISVLSLGDSLASSLGVRVKALRVVCLICASASAAAVVSFAGLLGFVGLIVPHMARKLFGGNVNELLISSSLTGAVLVTAADMLGRTLFAPTEIPVGIVMALIGAPFFLAMLLGRKSNA